MPNYMYNSNWADAARYGEGLGDSLAGAMYKLPQERLQMAMQMLQQQNQQRYQQQELGMRQQGLDLQRTKIGDNNDYKQKELAQQAQYQSMAQAIAMLRAQAEQDRTRIAGLTAGYPRSLGSGMVFDPRQSGEQQQQSQQGLVPPADPSNNLVQGPAAPQGLAPQAPVPNQVPGPQTSNMLPNGVSGLPPGVSQIPRSPGKVTGLETGNAMDANTMKATELYTGLLMNTNGLGNRINSIDPNVMKYLSNRVAQAASGLNQNSIGTPGMPPKIPVWNYDPVKGLYQ